MSAQWSPATEENFSHKRKRIPPKPQAQDPFADSRQALIHDLEQRCAILEERYNKQTEKLENFHLQMQKAKSERIQLQNKIKGVIQHISATMDQSAIPGAAIKNIPLEQEVAVLKWKLTVIEKYMKGIFPELLNPEK
ncbi:hypothetical protein SAMN05216436_11048 [bacterium A37T11]|nr:hypothetical protein SAMN05216436_11048 [bacterium A37T11]